MQVARALEVLGVAILDVGATGLEIAAVRAGADLFVGVVARQPDLDVVGLTGREAQVAGAQANHAIRKAQLLKQELGLGGHALELLVGLLRLGKLDHLDLVELVLADDTAGVATSGAGLLAEAGGEGGVAARQGISIENLAGVQVGKHDLGGGDQEVVARDVIGVVLELGQLTRAKHGLTLDDDGRPPLLKATAGVRVKEEVDEGTLKTGAGATENGKAATGELVAALEIEDVEVGAQVPVRLKVEVELARGAPTTALDVLVLVLAVRRGLARDVGKVSHKVVLLLLESGAALGQTVNLLVDGAHGLLGGLGLVLLALLHQGADLLGLGITRGLELLDLGDDGTALVVELEELLSIPRRLAVGHGGIDGIGVLANKLDIKH